MKIQNISLLIAAILVQQAHATMLVYDGFHAGGATPAANAYLTGVASTNGINNDSLHNQNPTNSNFSTSWLVSEATSQYTENIYHRAINNGLSYTGLLTTPGAAETFSTIQPGTTSRQINRAITGATTTSDGFWVSALMQFNEHTTGQFTGGRIEIRTSTAATGGTQKNHVIGFSNSGQLIAGSGTNINNSGVDIFSADTPHLILANFRTTTGRPVDIWINPDLSNIGTPDYSWAADQATTTIHLQRLAFNATTVTNSSFIYDEVRLGTTFESVSPIPEPGTFALVGIALGSLMLFRRRK